MIDPALLRENPKAIEENFLRRGKKLDIALFESLDTKLRDTRNQEEELRSKRNAISKKFGMLAKGGDAKELQELKDQASQIGEKIKALHEVVATSQKSFNDFMLRLPNLLHEDVPQGKSDEENKEIRKVGDIPKFSFKAKDHVELGEFHNMLDFAQAALMAQARFSVLSGHGAQLHRALAQFMLDLHVNEHGYQEQYLPYLINSTALTNTGQLPKFETDNEFFSCADDDLHLIPTSEVSLGNLSAKKTFTSDNLPLRLVCHSPCFRREAGSYGKDTRGMLRQHQFDKVELFQVCEPDKSEKAHEEILAHAEKVLNLLELPYRVVELCTGDIGNAAYRTFDLEVWLPGQESYREISSISNDTDFQARRMKARFKGDSKSNYVHMLNGSGIAIGRAWIAVIENYQNENGDITVPTVLRRYMGDKSILKPMAK